MPKRPPTGAGAPSLRAVCLALHRWIGLTVGVVLVLVGLTGSLNVFYREIDALLNPTLYAPATADRRIGAHAALQAAAAVHPAPVTAIAAPDAVWPVWVVTHAHPGGGKRLWTTTVDPSNGGVLGRRELTSAFANTVYRLHYTLLLREWWGEEFIGVVGIGLLLLALSGLYVWWPRLGRFWTSVSVRRGTTGQRLWLDLHKSAGFWASSVLLLIAATGVGIIYPGLVRPVIGLVSTATPQPSPKAPPREQDAPSLSADAIEAAAQAAYPDETVALLNPPTASRNSWRVLLRPREADPALRSRGALWLDPWTGRIIHDRSWTAMSNGDRYQTLQLWLHNGSMAGLFGRLVIAATGFVPLGLFGTGLAVWIDRRRRRMALTARPAAV